MAAASAACPADPGFPFPWSATERAQQRWADEVTDDEGIQRALEEQALSSSAASSSLRTLDMASMSAAAVCDTGRQEEAERDCSTRASSECGEEVARLKERWADLSDVDEPSSPAMPVRSSSSLTSAAALDSAAAAASVYGEVGDSWSVADQSSSQRSHRNGAKGGRGSRADHTKGWSSSWAGGSGAAGTWEQWEAPGANSWSNGGGERRRGGNGGGKARASWQRQRDANSHHAASAAYGSWQGGGSGATSSDATGWDTNQASGQHEDWWKKQGGWSSTSTRGAGASTRGNGRRGKWQCQFFVGIEEDEKFQVVRRLLGAHGKHVKAIFEKSKAKLRLRGRGSGFKEGPEKEESKDDLMLCVSATDQYGYTTCVNMLWAHLEDIYKQYAEFCKVEGWREVQLQVNMHEGPREGSF